MISSIRAVIYTRVSSAGQEDNASLHTQEARCHAHAEERGYRVADVFSDVYSGALYRERPGLSALREQVRAGAVDVVLAYAVDRLSRNQAHLAILAEEAEDHRARLEFVTEDFEDSAVGKFIRSAKSFAAEVEREKIGERTVRGRIERVKSGRLIPGGKPLYGYLWRDEFKGQLVEDPATADVVRRIFAAVAGGMTLMRIAKDLTAEGVPTPTGRGSVWHPSTLSTILHKPAYKGEAFGWGLRKAGVTPQTFDPDKAIRMPDGTIPALVDRKTWQFVQDILAKNKARSVRSARNPEAALLRGGFVRCGYCGRVIKVRPRSNGAYDYVCNPHHPDGCKKFSIVTHVLDDAVWNRAWSILTNPAIVAQEVERLRRDDPTADDLRVIDRALAEVERQRSNLARTLATIDDPEAATPLVAHLRELAKRQTSLQSERQEVQERQATWSATQHELVELEKWCRTVETNLSSLTWAEKRQALDVLGVSVTLYATDHQPRYVITAGIDVRTLSTTT